MRWSVLSSLALAVVVLAQSFAPLVAMAEGESDPLWNRPSYNKKVTDIGQRILAANGITERVMFVYNRSHVRNATATRAGGDTVEVYNDLLTLVDSDDEMAAVLSHEIAHITMRHQRRVMPARLGGALILAAVMTTAVLATGASNAGDPLATLYAKGARPDVFAQRKLEKEADLVGLDYMVKAGYNPLAMETFMNKIAQDGNLRTRLFTTHPMGTDRLQYIHTAIVNRYPQFLNQANRNNPVPGSPYQIQPPSTPNRTVNALPSDKQAQASNPSPGNDAANPATETMKVADSPSNQATQAIYNDLNRVLATGSNSPATASLMMATVATPPPAANPVANTAQPVSTPNSAGSPSQNPPVVAPTIKPNIGPYQTPPPKVSYNVRHTAVSAVRQHAGQSAKHDAPGSQSASGLTAPKQKPGLATTAVNSTLPKTSVAQTLLELQPDALRLVKLVSQRGFMTRQELNIEFEGMDDDTLDAMLLDLQNNSQLLQPRGVEPDLSYVLTPRAARVLSPQGRQP